MSRQTRILNDDDQYSVFIPYRVGDKIKFWMDDDQKVHKGEVLKVNLVLSAGNVEVWYEVKTLFRRRKTYAMIDETDILT
jgi:hypothetical protein